MSQNLDRNEKERMIEGTFASLIGFWSLPDWQETPLLRDFPSRKMRELNRLSNYPSADRQDWATYSLNEQQLLSNLPGMAYRCLNDSDWTMKFVSEGCRRLTGYEAAQLIDSQHCSYRSIIEPLDQNDCWEQVQTALEAKQPFTLEYRIWTCSGEQKWVWERGSGIYTPTGELLCLEGFITDISDRKRAEASLRLSEARYSSFFNNAFEGIFQTTIDGKLLSANPALAKIYGYDSPAELMETLTTLDLLYVDSERRADWVHLLLETGAVLEYESQVYRRDGSVVWISENARAVRDEQGQLLYFEGTVQDITERQQTKEQLHRQAFYDPLTGLANRTLFMERLQAVIESTSQNNSPESFAVLFLDLDRFKMVNDSFGHAVGDQLLVAIARRLESCLRDQDTVARLGGDEFTILLENLHESQQAIRVAERIKQKLGAPFQLGGHQVFTGVSIGIWLSDAVGLDPNNPEDLLRNADAALYQAKALGKGRYQIFDQTMHQSALRLLQLETDLRQALNRQEFELYYQPIVSLGNGELTGFEALLRWQHPTKGLISPEQFMAIAEESGLIVPIGLWGLATACRQLSHWQDSAKPITVGVNLSVKQFSQPQFVEQIDQILQETGVNSQGLRLEISESDLHDEASAIATLHALRERQIELCLDNFGSSSCLNYLHSFPVQALKFAQTLVHQLNTNTKQAKMARALLALAQDLDLKAIALGVETVDQLTQLRFLHCPLGQGYFFSKPLNAQAATVLLSSVNGDRLNVDPIGNQVGEQSR